MAASTCFANSGSFWVSAFFNSAIASSKALSKLAKNSFWAASSFLASSASAASSFLAISSISFSVVSAVFPVLKPSTILALSLAASSFNFSIVALILSAESGSFFASSSNSLIVSSKALSKFAKTSSCYAFSSALDCVVVAAYTLGDNWVSAAVDNNVAVASPVIRNLFFIYGPPIFIFIYLISFIFYHCFITITTFIALYSS